MKQRGFTLLETLIALVLMSLLMMALFGGFRAGIASWRVAESHIEQAEPQLLLGRMMYRHLSQVRIFGNLAGLGKSTVSSGSFEGHAGRIRYIAPLAQAVDDQLYVLELVNSPEGKPGVWIKYAPFESMAQIADQLELAEYQLISAELEVRFGYFVDDDWVDELTGEQVPALVRVHWAAGERVWPDSVFAITRG